MAEAGSNKSLTSSNENEMTESEIEVAEQLIELSMTIEVAKQLIQLSMINCRRKNTTTLEEELHVDDEAITKMKSQPKNHQKKKIKYRSLVDIYKTTTPI
ncbi:hypothetical protein P8452_28248 [Trifolium repens]|jgi:bacterioferritin (cytochrome b1)|nr:hypothetical protein P8452_28248 [Trifolium repens]